MAKQVKLKAWMRKHVLAGLTPGFQSKHARQRQRVPAAKVVEVLEYRHKRGRRVTQFELSKV